MAESTENVPVGREIIARKRHGFLNKLKIRWGTRRAASDLSYGAAAHGVFLSGVSGSYPDAASASVILAACDEVYYWKFAITLLLSIEEQAEPTAVHLHLCRPTEETVRHVASLSHRLRYVALSVTTDDCRLAQGLKFQTVYLASARFLIASEVMRRTNAPVLCIDVDSIVVKPVWPAFGPSTPGADAVLIQRLDETSDSRRLRAGAVGLLPTPNGTLYASSVARAIAALFAIGPIYHLDQIVLFYVMRSLQRRGRLVVTDMPPSLSDFDFRDDAIIWMAKGWAMKEAGLYADAKSAIDARFPEIRQSKDDVPL